jgi:hypothetical protein
MVAVCATIAPFLLSGPPSPAFTCPSETADPAIGPELNARRQIQTDRPVASNEMPHLHLPAEHDADDFAIAGALAATLRSEALYVTWSGATGHAARPVIPAAIEQACEPRRRSLGGRLLQRVRRRR